MLFFNLMRVIYNWKCGPGIKIFVASIFLVLFALSCASSGVTLVRNEEPYFKREVRIQVLDKAIIDLPFEPKSVKVFNSDVFSAEWHRKKIVIKGLSEGEGRVALSDEDGIALGTIDVLIEPR